jgi:hypothetical protein
LNHEALLVWLIGHRRQGSIIYRFRPRTVKSIPKWDRFGV